MGSKRINNPTETFLDGYSSHTSAARIYDPKVRSKPKSPLTPKEREEIMAEVGEDCVRVFVSKSSKTQGGASRADKEDMRQEAYIFIIRMMDVFDKKKIDAVDAKGKTKKKDKPLSYYFYNYFVGRAHLVNTNVIGKKKRRHEDRVSDSEVKDVSDFDASFFTATYAENSSTVEQKAEALKFIKSLKGVEARIFNDFYIEGKSKSEIKRAYGQDYKLFAPRLARRINRFKSKIGGL